MAKDKTWSQKVPKGPKTTPKAPNKDFTRNLKDPKKKKQAPKVDYDVGLCSFKS